MQLLGEAESQCISSLNGTKFLLTFNFFFFFSLPYIYFLTHQSNLIHMVSAEQGPVQFIASKKLM